MFRFKFCLIPQISCVNHLLKFTKVKNFRSKNSVNIQSRIQKVFLKIAVQKLKSSVNNHPPIRNNFSVSFIEGGKMNL